MLHVEMWAGHRKKCGAATKKFSFGFWIFASF